MNDLVQLELAGASSFMLEDGYDQAMAGIDGLAPLSESEWANLFLTLGSADDSGAATDTLEWNSNPFSNEMEATSTIISTTPPFYYPTISTSTTLPSSPESGSESSPQSSPQTSPYNDFLFSLPVLAIKDEAPSPSSSTSMNTSTSTLPSIEPFPPRSPIFAAHDDQMRSIIGNVGVAAPMDVVPISSKAVVSSPTSGSYRQHLGEPLVRPAGIINPASAAAAAADDDDCAAGKKRRRAATAGAVPSEIAAATSGVVLPRDTLLKLSSSEMEAYLQTLKSSRELTHAEEKQLKKQLRLIKNREYAQESRKKKKSAHQELEGELNSLRTQNSELRTHNSALQSEVVLLNSKLAAVTSENTRLRSALRQMQHFHHSQKKQKTNANNKRQRDDDGDYPGAAPSSPSSWFSLGLGSASVQSPRAVAGGVCLLGVAIFALSFLLQGPGMFVGSSTHGDMGWSPTARVILEQEETRTTHFRRSTWVASPPTSTITDTSTQQDAKPATQGKGVAKCGYDNMCYLYVDKAHHVKTLEISSGSLAQQQQEQQQRHDDDIPAAADHLRHNRTHHAIPIPVH